MNRSDGPEQTPKEPGWDEKVLRLSDTLTEHHFSYAFGGAIALNYHREPRATIDIDINIFVSPEQETAVLLALAELYDLSDQEKFHRELSRDGQTRTSWGDTYVDLFFANTAFHESMAKRIEYQPFGDCQIPVLSIEDLLVCKVLFDRPKDWLDLEAVAQTQGQTLDQTYIISWLNQALDPDDTRLQRVKALLGGTT